MKRKIKKILDVMPLVLLVGGLLVAARPIYHLCRWKINEITARNSWEKWQHSYYYRAKLSGSPAVWLRAPGADLSTLVIHGASENNLTAYPCLETSCPGLNEPGIKLILGHRDMHFRKLKNIQVGYSIELEFLDKKIKKYQVMEIEILTPEQVVERVKEKKQEDWLVLVTCYPFKYVGPAPKRFTVWSLLNHEGTKDTK
ncbi:MAG: sortase [Candidatus Aminicenantes bacterium]|nr:sortase [Candidatus Aminicenantes bacterium]NIM83095.1 sortase [Candidatus Aminicenantes bacterium]NIN22474.1 sortase [Candidatus Aminicenantes bacterium]NIN46242.1 sortase [Candidatus Aminicenantes bacterium]NIN89079.1 sortase [Candidatus Aminicenantes bacterium]